MRVRTERAEIAGEVVIVLKRRQIALRLLLRLAARLRLGCLRIVRVAIIRRVTAPDVADRTGRVPSEYSRLTLGLPRHGTCEQMPEFCAAA